MVFKSLLLVAASSLLLAGCPAAHSDYPTKSCKTNSDCYQGEACNLTGGDTGTCVNADDDGGAQ